MENVVVAHFHLAQNLGTVEDQIVHFTSLSFVLGRFQANRRQGGWAIEKFVASRLVYQLCF